MKTKLMISICVLGLAACSVNTARADDPGASAVADILIMRPLSLAATAFGGVLWVVSLPFTAIGGHVKEAAHTLVRVPADATFKRPLGDFSSLQQGSS